MPLEGHLAGGTNPNHSTAGAGNSPRDPHLRSLAQWGRRQVVTREELPKAASKSHRPIGDSHKSGTHQQVAGRVSWRHNSSYAEVKPDLAWQQFGKGLLREGILLRGPRDPVGRQEGHARPEVTHTPRRGRGSGQ